MRRKIVTMLLSMGCLLSIPMLTNASEDYSYLDDMTINQLKALDEEIHKRIPVNYDSTNETENVMETEESDEIKISIDDVTGKWMDKDLNYVLAIDPSGRMYCTYLNPTTGISGSSIIIREFSAEGFSTLNGGEFTYSNDADTPLLTCTATDVIPKDTVFEFCEDKYSMKDLQHEWYSIDSKKHIIIGDIDLIIKSDNGGSSTKSVDGLLVVGDYLYDINCGLLKIEMQDNEMILTSDQYTYKLVK